jgi:hypothetical protein
LSICFWTEVEDGPVKDLLFGCAPRCLDDEISAGATRELGRPIDQRSVLGLDTQV